MIIREDYLVTINSKNRIQKIQIQIDHNPITDAYSIYRISGQYGGKSSEQPPLNVDYGRGGRTIFEQTTLMYDSFVEKYQNRGYVKLSSLTPIPYESLTESEIKDLLGGDVISDQCGVPKPMLAKLSDVCTPDIWNKDWYISRKLDGIRCLLYFKGGLIHSASRGGKTYDKAIQHILTNPTLLEIFRKQPDLILDGEIYRHGSDWPLQRISGLARLQNPTEDCLKLEYWIYDYVDLNVIFEQRYEVLKVFKELLIDEPNIKVLEQIKASGYSNIKKEHDKYVQEGFEGLCARNPNKSYGVNKRSALYLIKMKDRKDAEFKIIGIREGLRPEDMCFVLETKNKKQFAAKPIGDAETRIYYLDHKEDFIGKMATCTYFNLSLDGIPTQPVLKH